MSVTKAQLLNPIGVSTFNNGPVLIGSATSTGTATQRLQVTGGAYVSANLGVGITNPQNPLQVGSESNIVIVDSLGDLGIGTASATSKLHVVGNALVSGVVTATSFVGNVVGGAGTFTNLTVNGTQTIINTTSLEIADKTVGIASTSTPSDTLADGAGITIYGTTNKTLTYNNTKKGFETNIPIATNETRIISGAEKVHRQSGNTVTLTYNSSSSSIVGYAINPTGDITVNVVDVPTSSDFDDHSITFAVIVNNTGTARTCNVVNINGVPRTIRWAGGSLGAALSGVTTTTGHTIFSFTGINTVGSASTALNYTVFGVVSGGFW